MSLDLIRRYLSYDPGTGAFTWIKAPQNRIAVGSVAGTINRNGYRRIIFGGRNYPAHHLAWWFTYGFWPPGQIDHVNGARSDDRIANLRPATANQNARNRRSAKGSSSQYLGVTWHARYSCWRAQINFDRRVRHLGYFQDEKDAARAYDAVALDRFGEFANLNFPREAAA